MYPTARSVNSVIFYPRQVSRYGGPGGEGRREGGRRAERSSRPRAVGIPSAAGVFTFFGLGSTDEMMTRIRFFGFNSAWWYACCPRLNNQTNVRTCDYIRHRHDTLYGQTPRRIEQIRTRYRFNSLCSNGGEIELRGGTLRPTAKKPNKKNDSKTVYEQSGTRILRVCMLRL